MFVDYVMGVYGYNIEHILMVDIIPDQSVRKAMNEINAGKRCAWRWSCLH
ncbi:hypothetical protein Scep_016870 [Stephania cephalantha]|uniref:Uncharacterized protein n=1 Tax=Stephania cephalantha TaxID=152367 RepID=A0AAP0NT28_9MAGN